MAVLLRNGTVFNFSGVEQCPTELKLRDPLASRVNLPCYAVIKDSEVFVAPIPCENRIHVFNLPTGTILRSIEVPPAENAPASPNLILKHGRIYAYRAHDTKLHEIRSDRLVKVARTTHAIMSLQITDDRDPFQFVYSNKSGQIFSVRSGQEKCAVEHELEVEGSKSNYIVGHRKGDLILWTSRNELLVVHEDKTQYKQKILMALSVRSFVVKDNLYMWHGNTIGVFNLSTKKFTKVRLDPPFFLLKHTRSTNITYL